MTRLAVLSDVHANLHALSAVLAVLADEGIDHYLCTGDLVGYGVHPDECIELLRALPVLAVAGNHDMIATGRTSDDRCDELARSSLRWTREHLAEGTRSYLAALPLTRSFDRLVLTHGSLHSPFEYVRTPQAAAAQLELLAKEHPEAQVLLHGHTHMTWAVGETDGVVSRTGRRRVRLRPGQRYLLNPGSVGQSRQRSPHARFLVLDLARAEVVFHALRYDMAACKADLRRHGRPTESCHRRPPFALGLRRRLPPPVRQALSHLRQHRST